MIFDYELMFVDDKDGTQKDISAGVLGEAIDLSGDNQGKGRPGLIAIAFSSDTTASGRALNILQEYRGRFTKLFLLSLIRQIQL